MSLRVIQSLSLLYYHVLNVDVRCLLNWLSFLLLRILMSTNSILKLNLPLTIELGRDILERLCRSKILGLPFILSHAYAYHAAVNISDALESLVRVH